jgi:hypothetical protein
MLRASQVVPVNQLKGACLRVIFFRRKERKHTLLVDSEQSVDPRRSGPDGGRQDVRDRSRKAGGYMRARFVSVFSNVAELGLFFIAALALCLGLLGLR